MDMQDEQFLLGQMHSDLKNLTEAVHSLNSNMVLLSHEIEGIKLFRAKVLGGSLVVSVLGSAAFWIGLSLMEKAWAK